MSVIDTNQLMLYREIIAVCCQDHTKHKNTRCGQKVVLLNVKHGAAYRKHRAIDGHIGSSVSDVTKLDTIFCTKLSAPQQRKT